MQPKDEFLLDLYMVGFEDELRSNPKVEYADTLHERAYQLGRIDALIGDDVRSVDYQTNEEILHRIYNLKP
jgi:hypothetical protein